ncbi:hypothetical protein [Thalassospira lucentensis]|uniref:hypothetical protein n=1 Tax=Thalassospira lucentensis TaxID=168935 RepID=UPI003AA81424|tara:strand:+ start:193167 stop:193787 length:621 start_codon:yes stop_codon:yes gene_type:complete
MVKYNTESTMMELAVRKYEFLLNGIPFVVLLAVAAFVGALYTTEFRELQWETLAAGFFGLLGGYAAYFGARTQHMAETLSNAMSFKLKHYDAVINVRKEINVLIDYSNGSEELFIENCIYSRRRFDSLALALTDSKCLPTKMFEISSSFAQQINEWRSAVDCYAPEGIGEDIYGREPATFADISRMLRNLDRTVWDLQEYLTNLRA